MDLLTTIITIAAIKNRQDDIARARQKQKDEHVAEVGRGNSAIAMNSPVQGFGRGNPFFDPWAEGGKFNPKRR